MDWNNILTDAQLEVIFAATDEDMQQIKQPMECTVERTQRKCKKCVRFYSNKAALKQHHVNLPSKRKNAPIAAKPSIALITWRSTSEVARKLLHNLSNDNYVKRCWMDPPRPRMDPQHLRN